MRLFSPAKLADIRNLGFNQRVDVAQRVFHVQTEVSGSQELLVRTTVLEGGKVLRATNVPLVADPKQVAMASKEVKALHDAIVQQVRDGTVI